jgi:hypothetical protein
MICSAAMSRRGLALSLLLYVELGAALLIGVARDFGNLGRNDWNAFLGEQQAEMTSLLDHGQWPAWNPWRRGGQVALAQPESMLFSPVTPLAALVGTPRAFQLWLLPLFVLGCLGMQALAGELGLRGGSRLVPPLVFFGASVFPLYVTGGLPNWLFGMALLPWLVWANRRAAADLRFVALAAALYAGTLFCGSVHHFVFFPLVLAVDSLVVAVARRSLRPLLVAGAAVLAGALLAGARLVPVLELYREFPREVSSRPRFLPLDLLPRVFLDWRLPDLAKSGGGLLEHRGSVVYWINCGAFVGPVALLLAAIGTVAGARKAAGPLLLFVLFAWMALGSGVSFSLWDALHELPVLGSMKAPERMILIALFGLALLAGAGFDPAARLVARIAGRLGVGERAMRIAWLVLLLFPMLLANFPITEAAFPIPPPEELAPGTFRQRLLPARPEQWGGPLYEAVLANVGSVNATSDVPSAGATRAEGEFGYRGEAWLENRRGEIAAEITPNVIRVRGRLAGADTLLVNQNYFPGWRASGSATGECREQAGLIALDLPAGEHDLELHFAPSSIPLGAAASGAAAAILLAWWLARRAKARKDPAWRPADATRADLVALGACMAGLLAIGAWDAQQPHGRAAGVAGFWPAELGRPADAPLQPQVDAAASGALLRVRGEADVLTLRRGMTIVADPPASAVVGELRILELPADETLVVQGVRVKEGGGKVEIRGCAGVVIVEGLSEGVEVDVTGSPQVFLIDGETRAVSAPAPGEPRVELLGALAAGQRVKLRASGPAGARGMLRLARRPRRGEATAAGAAHGANELDERAIVVEQTVTLPESGELLLDANAELIAPRAGAGWFLQLVVTDASGRVLVSPLGARLFEPPRARRRE